MRGIKQAILTYTFNLPLLILSAPPTPSVLAGPGGEKGTTLASTVTSSILSAKASSIPASTLMLQNYPAQSSTTSQVVDISSSVISTAIPNTASSRTSLSTSLSVSAATAISNSTSALSSSSMSSSTSSKGTLDTHQRNLVIILSSVLGFFVLLLIAGIILLVVRYRRGQTPFGHRGASPIDDDEIESWRKSGQEKREPPQHGPAIREVSELPLGHHTQWSWATTASSASIHTVPNLFADSPSYIATAPNARAGLTDEAIPGADPFITPPKRQSSRISKLPPGHSRHRSRRSSMSAKSLWSNGHSQGSSDVKAKGDAPAWYDSYDDRPVYPSAHLKAMDDGVEPQYDKRPAYNRAYLKEMDLGIDSPRTSVLFDDLESGGLSPRPKSVVRGWERSDDIGRAIA